MFGCRGLICIDLPIQDAGTVMDDWAERKQELVDEKSLQTWLMHTLPHTSCDNLNNIKPVKIQE